MQHVFADLVFIPRRAGRFSVVLIERNNMSFWFPKIILLFRVEQNRFRSDREYFTVLKYFKETPPLFNVDEINPWVFLRWASGNAGDLSFHYSIAERVRIAVEEWYGLNPFSARRSVRHVVSSNHFVRLFSAKVPWPAFRFYVSWVEVSNWVNVKFLWQIVNILDVIHNKHN